MKILVVFGGKSVEHEISVISAFQVIESLRVKYDVYPVYVSKSNKFYYNKSINTIDDFKLKKYKRKDRIEFINKNGCFFIKGRKKINFDLIFPIVHGKGVEDGTILSYFRFKGFDVVGSDISFYSACQNKKMTKMILDGLNIRNVKYESLSRGDDIKNINMPFPLIVKPNNLGSSIGIKVVNNLYELEREVNNILKMDDEVLIEEYLQDSREFNISVLSNNGKIETSLIEEVRKGDIYSYEEKYLQDGKKKGMHLRKEHAFEVEKIIKEEIETIAKTIYKKFAASGVIRIDFLYKNDLLYVNEINTIPGSYAYYLWEEKYDFLELLDIVINESKRYLFFSKKNNYLIAKDIIFAGLNKY